MFKFLTEWFSQGFSVPVIVTDAVSFAFGLIGSLKIRRNRTVIISMLILAAVFLVSALAAICGIVIIETYAKFLAMFVLLAFAGAAVGLVVRFIKK